jgi:diaminopimelate epimerase
VTIEFCKMNGAGNDFVMVDNRSGTIVLTGSQVAWLCDRRRGVGGDGLILVEPAPGHDFFMRYYNADGSPEVMCGNGARCSAWFAASLGLGRREGPAILVRFMTGSGEIEARVEGSRVSMSMMDGRSMRRGLVPRVAPPGAEVHFMIVGTRHAVVLVRDVDELSDEDVCTLGRSMRHDPAFAPEGANINFASVAPDGRVRLRTYEKGVEAETMACGTGSVASAAILAHLGRVTPPVRVVQRSGDELVVSFSPSPAGAEGVRLEGPVAVNFHGRAEVPAD